MTDSESPSTPGGCLRPVLVVSCLMPLHFTVGALFGQSAGMLPQLMEGGSFIKVDREEATWIASMPTIGTCIASCVSGSLSDMFGRIRLAQAALFFIAVGYAMMVAANGFVLILVGRFFTGIGIGCSFPASVYASEVAPPAYRGILLGFTPLLASTGLVYMYIVGGYFPWNIAAGVTCLISILGLVLTFFCYDTPVWLVRKNKIDAARKSLKRIEGSANFEARLKELREIADSQPVSKFSLRVFAEPTVWKPFMMLLMMSVLQNTAGFYIVISYTVQFMREFHSTYDPLQITVAVGVVRLLAMLLTSFLLRRMGRRTIGAASGFSSATMLLLVYAYLRFEGGLPYLHDNSWIPIGLFLAYILTMTLGMFPLPWTMPYEVFPLKVRGMMCGASFCSMYLVMFFSVKAYNILMDNLRLEGMILMFAVSSAVFGVFSVTILVETHNKTLDEIEGVFAGGKQIQENGKT